VAGSSTLTRTSDPAYCPHRPPHTHPLLQAEFSCPGCIQGLPLVLYHPVPMCANHFLLQFSSPLSKQGSAGPQFQASWTSVWLPHHSLTAPNKGLAHLFSTQTLTGTFPRALSSLECPQSHTKQLPCIRVTSLSLSLSLCLSLFEMGSHRIVKLTSNSWQVILLPQSLEQLGLQACVTTPSV
jgi:hypothetical protein